MDTLQLIQQIQNKKSHQTSYLCKNNGPTSETRLTIQSGYPYQETFTNMRSVTTRTRSNLTQTTTTHIAMEEMKLT